MLILHFMFFSFNFFVLLHACNKMFSSRRILFSLQWRKKINLQKDGINLQDTMFCRETFVSLHSTRGGLVESVKHSYEIKT